MAWSTRATWWPATGTACRCIPPASMVNTWPAFATAPGVRRNVCIRRSPFTRRWSSTWSTPGPADRSAAARTTCRIPAADFVRAQFDADWARVQAGEADFFVVAGDDCQIFVDTDTALGQQRVQGNGDLIGGDE